MISYKSNDSYYDIAPNYSTPVPYYHLGDYEDLALTTTNQTMEKDGVLFTNQTCYVNDTVVTSQTTYISSHNLTISHSVSVPFSKGDSIRASSARTVKVRYYGFV